METRSQWGTRAGFILAAAGSAIGLGNIWRFPAVAYENGGRSIFYSLSFCSLNSRNSYFNYGIYVGAKVSRFCTAHFSQN